MAGFYSITRTVMGKGINEQYSGNADMAGERPPKLSVFNFEQNIIFVKSRVLVFN
jgi:hypothetical protein